MTEFAAERIPPLPREEWTDAARDVFAYWEGPEARETGSRSNTMMVLANHPALAIASLDFGKYVLLHSTMTPRQKELIVLRAAWRYKSGYQWAHHVVASKKMGFTDAELEALQREADPADWNRDEYALLSAMDQLTQTGRIDDATWSVLKETMDTHQVMDFLYTIGLYTMNAWAFGAMGVQLEVEFDSFKSALDPES